MSETARPSSSSPFWKLVALALFLSLIGVYLLYSWYDNRLQAQIAEKDALLVQQSGRIKELESKRLAAEESLHASRAESERLKAEFQAERQALSDQIRLLEEARAGLGQDLEGIKAAHAKALAEERRKTAEVVAERDRLQAELASERQRVEQLQSNLARVNQAIAEAMEGHRKRVAELERHLNERISLARTTPEDAEVLRTLQQLNLLGAPAGRSAEAQALAAELAATRAELERIQRDYESVRGELEETQNALQQAQAALERKGQEAESQAQQGRTILERLAQLESELEAERQAHAELQQSQASLQETLAEREQQLAQLQAELETARAEPANKEEALAAAQSRIRELETALAEIRAQSSQAQAASKQALDEAQARIAELESALESTRAAGQTDRDIRARLEALTAELEQARAQLQELEAARGRIAVLESELENSRQQAGGEGDAAVELNHLRNLIAELAELHGAFTERGLLVQLAESELRFPPGRAELPAGDLASLDRLAALLKAHPKLRARIEGHTDSSGNPAINQTLSQQRAESVRAALVERGIAPERLAAEGLGANRPLADNSTSEGRARNRRVEVYLID